MAISSSVPADAGVAELTARAPNAAIARALYATEYFIGPNLLVNSGCICTSRKLTNKGLTALYDTRVTSLTHGVALSLIAVKCDLKVTKYGSKH